MDAPKTWAREKAALAVSVSWGYSEGETIRQVEAALLEADKNGYERGRKETIEGISDVIGEHQEESGLSILRAVVQYLGKARFAPSGVSDGKESSGGPGKCVCGEASPDRLVIHSATSQCYLRPKEPQ